MSTIERNVASRARSIARGTGSAMLGLCLLSTPAFAADGPAQPRQASEQAADEPAPRPKRSGLDDVARRALRASSSRAEAPPTRDDLMAMRAAAPAASDPPKRRESKKKPRKDADGAGAPGDDADRKISLDEDFLVEGKLEKPNAFYILRRSQSGYDWARLDAKFLPLVLESVQDPLF